MKKIFFMNLEIRPQQSVSILIADDDEDERTLLTYAFNDIGVPCEETVRFVEDGEALLSCLHTLAPVSYPNLIVLDINMPKLDGIQTLKVLKTSPEYQRIPVMVFSTLADERQIPEILKLGAVSVDLKSRDYAHTIHLARKFFDYACTGKSTP